MIIGRKHKYALILNGGTGSSSMAEELKENYGGEEVLWKHAQIPDFLKVATAREREFFFFAGIRNPLDRLITIYLRMKNENLDIVEENLLKAQHDGNPVTMDRLKKHLEKRRLIQNEGLSFSDFFIRFLKGGRWNAHKELNIESLNFIYRYENLQEDFVKILNRIGLSPIRPLSNWNPTPFKNHFLSYYTPEIVPDVIEYTQDCMKTFGYAFPEDWV